MIRFSRVDQHVGSFLNRYLAWASLQKLYGQHDIQVDIDLNANNGIKIYSRREVELITRDSNPVVAISLKEGIKEIDILDRTLPTNKHYIIFSGSYPSKPLDINLRHTLVCHENILAQIYDLHFRSYGTFFCSNRTYNFNDPKPWEFVSFNATERLHRLKFAEWLSELPASNFVYRLNKKDYGQSADDIDFINFSQVDTEISEWFDNTAKHMTSPNLHIMGRIPNEMMNRARFNLVLETAFDFPTFDTTEKTIRPLLLGMPFVLASSPGHLKRLHSYGFRTYNSLWDESYDDEQNNDLRLRKIFELAKQLATFDWNKNQQELEYIGLHNRANFTNLGWLFDQEFRNFEQAMKEFRALNLIDVPV